MRKLTFISLILLIVSACGGTDEKLARKADKIHDDFLTVDTHCDTPLSLVSSGFDLGVRHAEGCVDFPRMVEGGLDAEFFAVFIGQGPRNDTAYNNVYKDALGIFESIHSNVSKNFSMAELALSPADAYRLKKNKKISAFIGLENGYPVGKDISKVKEFYDLGARYITLCHSSNNDICDSSTDSKGPEHQGLSAFGLEVVREMNRLGMMIDVSHISDEAFYDVISITKAPVIASHSSSRALCSSPRNLTDDMLRALKTNGGVIQICVLSSYIKTADPNPVLDEKLQELKSKYGDLTKLTEHQKKNIVQKEKKFIINTKGWPQLQML